MVLSDGRRIAALHTDADLHTVGPREDGSAWFARLLRTPLVGAAALVGDALPPLRVTVAAADSRRLVAGDVRAGRGSGPSVIAVGDPEMAFDPLSSLGILGAISSAEEGVGVIRAMLEGRGGPDGAAAREAVDTRERARDARWSRYRERLAHMYAEEARWPDARFWSRRPSA